MQKSGPVRSIADGAAGTASVFPAARGTLLAQIEPLCPDWRGPAIAVGARTLELRHANRSALAMLRRGLPVRLLGNRIAANSPPAARRLAAALRSLDTRGAKAAMMVIDDEDTQETFALRIYLPNLPLATGAERIAIVEFSDALLELQPPLLRAIAEAFGLTAAEGVVLGLLATGCSLREIAEQRGVHLETVRHQCKTVLSKMHCRRQSDLVRVVALLSQQGSAASVA